MASRAAPQDTRKSTDCERAGQSVSSVPDWVCRQQIERIVGSRTFARTEQLRRLLKWLAERSLQGTPAALSEKEIAEFVLNRRDFDPRTDSIVRKEVARMREKISRYYLDEGAGDAVAITSRDGYVLKFEPREVAATNEAGPCWLVLPFRMVEDPANLVIQLLEEVLILIHENAGPRVVSPGTALSYRLGDRDLRDFAAECGANFVVEGSLHRTGVALTANVWLVEGRSGHSQGCRRVRSETPMDLARQIVRWLLECRESLGT